MTKRSILIIDRITQKVEEFSSVLSDLSDFHIDNSIKYDESIAYFDNNKYEYIIMDHSCKDADLLLEYILTKNPQQKFILLSDTLNCPVDCTFCLNTFQFVRLLKPVKLLEVFKLIKGKVDFVCPNKHRFENIDSIEKLYDLINIDEYGFYKIKEIVNGSLYFRPKDQSNIDIDELNKIQDLVNSDFFESEVLGDFCIKVQMKI